MSKALLPDANHYVNAADRSQPKQAGSTGKAGGKQRALIGFKGWRRRGVDGYACQIRTDSKVSAPPFGAAPG